MRLGRLQSRTGSRRVLDRVSTNLQASAINSIGFSRTLKERGQGSVVRVTSPGPGGVFHTCTSDGGVPLARKGWPQNKQSSTRMSRFVLPEHRSRSIGDNELRLDGNGKSDELISRNSNEYLVEQRDTSHQQVNASPQERRPRPGRLRAFQHSGLATSAANEPPRVREGHCSILPRVVVEHVSGLGRALGVSRSTANVEPELHAIEGDALGAVFFNLGSADDVKVTRLVFQVEGFGSGRAVFKYCGI